MFTKSTRKQQLLRILSLYLAFSLLFDYIAPVAAFALTSGPGQPEFSSFEPVGTSDMVDLYSGDFTYNIPLLSVPGPNGGYPINLAYHSGPGVDEEASWTGLGWTVNVGAVNRQLRGLPDDFKGDNVVQKYRLKTNRTTTLNLYGQKSELFGYPQSVSSSALTSISPQIYYNSYKGLGYRVTLGINASKTYINYGLQMSYDSQNGVGVEPDFSVAGTIKGVEIKANGGVGYSSREGIRGSFAVTPSPVIGLSQSQLSFSSQFNVPSVSVPMRTDIFPFSAHINLTNGTSAFPGAFSAAWPKSWSGSVIESKVDNGGYVSSDGYGYLYNSHSSNTADLKDFQRGYIPYSKKVPNLPPSHLTYDMFMQTAQGTGSSFRSYSNYVGVTGDPLRQSNDYSTQLNLEVGTMSVPSTPPALHFGIGYTSETGANKSGPWIDVGSTSDVVFGSILDYKRINEIKRSEPDFEDSPFKVYGEKTGTLLSEDLLSLWGGDEAVRVDLDMSNDQSWLDRQFIAKNQFIRHAGDPSPITAGASHNLKTPQRQRRSTNIEQLTGPEAQKYGVTRNVSYTVNPSGGYDFLTPVAKTFNTTGDKSNHISEMSVVQADGMRYIYGLPAYNNKQVDISFAANVSGSPNFNTKYANMDPLDGSHPWDVSTAGTTDDYVSQTELPPFVHSWLLTAVVSDDYVDLTDNGPTEDDYGYWVNFSYKKESTDYAWHIPYKDANYVEGNKGDPTDDRATASYGNREQYYLEYVETKTHIAVFYTSVREDGVEVQSSDLKGGMPATVTADNKLRKLDSICLYAKNEFFASLATRQMRVNPVPVKTVHFRYTYDLCGKDPLASNYYAAIINNNTGVAVDEDGGDPAVTGKTNINSGKGKLTLTKLWFTYQTSERGELSPYIFKYGTISSFTDNPYYDPSAVDRWGSHKNISAYAGLFSGNKYPYVDMPYTDQDAAPSTAGAWCLKKITLPSGAVISVDYESDDYAYVENKKALRMFDIFSVSTNTIPSVSANARTSSTIISQRAEGLTDLPNGPYKIYFKLEGAAYPSTTTTPAQEAVILQDYLDNGNLKFLYFKAFMDLLDQGIMQQKDYVNGYAEIDYTAGSYGMEKSNGSTDYDLGFISLKGEDLGTPVNATGLQVNPLIKAAIQHLHFNRSELVHSIVPYSSSAANQIVNLMGTVYTSWADIGAAIFGFNTYAYGKNYCRNIDLNGFSTIRLCDPNGKKYGGGSRVKQIRVNDNWRTAAYDPTLGQSGSLSDNYEYGLDYTYTITENGDTISSGVAYEPNIGGEESALRNPVNYTNSTLLLSHEKLFVETPVLESYYPGASVGYRKVTATSIAPATAKAENPNNNLLNSAAPITIYEFYTPKDFPVITDETDMNGDKAIVRPIMIPGIFTSFKKRQARSQGYSIILNDMAGKPRSITMMTRPNANNPNGTLITKSTYIYQTEAPYDPNAVNKLVNKAQVLASDGTYQTAIIGQTEDIFIDMNENQQKSRGIGMEGNLDMGSIASVPFAVPTFFPHINKNELIMRTVVVNKVIYRTGILQQVINQHESSVIKTEIVAYDLQTAQPLLTKVTNEFGDPLYSYTYPGHWYYPSLAGEYLNHAVVVDCEVIQSGVVVTISPMTAAANGRITLTNYLPSGKTAKDYFIPGDEVWVDFASISDDRYHVVKVGTSYIDLIDENGAFIATSQNINSIRVIRSGHDNLQSVAAGSLTSRTATVTAFNPQTGTPSYTTAQSYSLSGILNAAAVEFSEIWQAACNGECVGHTTTYGNAVNPYELGIRGIWRPYKSYAYSTSRTQTDDIKVDGEFTIFHRFKWEDPANTNANWIAANTMTLYSPYSFELENKNAIGIYSAALYEYNQSLSTAVASNAKHKEIASEAFEDYPLSACDNAVDHWGFRTYTANMTTAQAHTGKYSLMLADGADANISSSVYTLNCEADMAAARLVKDTTNNASAQYLLDTCDCLGKFIPEPDRKYVASAWVKQTPVGGSAINTLATYTSPEVKVEVYSGTTLLNTYTQAAAGPVIEGWQRVFFTFDVPANATSIKVILNNNSSTASDDYFDDVRIHPYDANMVTYVYDPRTYRLMAQLDANNFATFYIYDEQGSLEKIKVETEGGIKTVQEGRTNIDKHSQ